MPQIALHHKKLELVQVAAAITQAEETVAAQGIRRDALIRELSEAGVSRREVAELAGVTPGRVQQLLAGSLFKVQLSEGTPIYPDGTTGPRGRDMDWEGVARSEAAAVNAARADWRKVHGEAFPGGAVSIERAGTPA
jgi:hypothetical protein